MSLRKLGPIFVHLLPLLWWLSIASLDARAEGVVWLDLTLDEALAEAQETGQILMIDVAADHCGACGDMDAAFWDTPEGAEFVEGMVPIQIDSTTPEGQALNRRYPVTGLPLVIFIRPDGTEIDRVVGFTSKRKFLEEALLLRDGFDPLPMLEEELASHPDSIPLFLPVLERYLNRFRVQEAESLLVQLLELDADNRYGQAERALRTMAKHMRIVAGDMEKSLEYWKELLDRYPGCSTASAAIQGSYRAAASLGRTAEWKEWICQHVENEQANGRLQYAVAMTAKRYRMRGPCFAKAARTARALGKGGPFLDTLAVELEGADRR